MLQPKAGLLPKTTVLKKQTSAPIPNSGIGVLNPQTLSLDTVTTSYLIRPAGTTQLLCVAKPITFFFVKQKPLSYKG